MKIGKKFEFEASHKLPDDEVYGKCCRLHGHRYELIVEIEGEVNQQGWICNFNKLKEIVENQIIEKYDHSYLNDYIEVPTVENIIIEIGKILRNRIEKEKFNISKIVLYETSNSYAEINS